MTSQKNDDKKVLSVIDIWSAEYIGGLCLLFTTIGIFVNIILRKVFSTAINGLEEIIALCMMIITFLTVSINQKEGTHIKMSLVIDKLHPNSKKILEIFVLLLCTGFFVLFGYGSIFYILELYKRGAVSPTLYIPTWPFYLSVIFGTVLVIFRFLFEIINRLKAIDSSLDKIV